MKNFKTFNGLLNYVKKDLMENDSFDLVEEHTCIELVECTTAKIITKYAMDNISYAMQNFPKATLRLAKILKTNLDNGNIVDIMTNTVPARKEALERHKKLISKNIKFLDDVVNGRIKREDFQYDML